MVEVEVCEYDGHHGLAGQPPELGEHLPGRGRALHRVDDDDAVLTLEQTCKVCLTKPRLFVFM